MTRPNYLGLAHKAFMTGNPASDVCSAQLDARRRSERSGPGRPQSAAGPARYPPPDVDVMGRMDGTGKVQAAAMHMLANPSIGRAFDLKQEPEKLRERYGRHLWGNVVSSLAGWPKLVPQSSPLMP